VTGAKEGDAFLQEFTNVGFQNAQILKTHRNERTNNKKIIAADVYASK